MLIAKLTECYHETQGFMRAWVILYTFHKSRVTAKRMHLWTAKYQAISFVSGENVIQNNTTHSETGRPFPRHLLQFGAWRPLFTPTKRILVPVCLWYQKCEWILTLIFEICIKNFLKSRSRVIFFLFFFFKTICVFSSFRWPYLGWHLHFPKWFIILTSSTTWCISHSILVCLFFSSK